MSKDLKRSLWISGSLIFISLLIPIIFKGSLNLLSFVNALFISSMCVSLIGLLLFVIKGGTFDFFTYSYKKVWKLFSRDRESFDSNIESAFALSESVDKSLMRSLLYSGCVFVFVSMVLAFSL